MYESFKFDNLKPFPSYYSKNCPPQLILILNEVLTSKDKFSWFGYDVLEIYFVNQSLFNYVRDAIIFCWIKYPWETDVFLAEFPPNPWSLVSVRQVHLRVGSRRQTFHERVPDAQHVFRLSNKRTAILQFGGETLVFPKVKRNGKNKVGKRAKRVPKVLTTS